LRVVPVGDRGMITDARIEETLRSKHCTAFLSVR